MQDSLANNTAANRTALASLRFDEVESRLDSRDAANLKNMLLLIQLRWIAAVGQVATIVVVHFGLHITLPLAAMSAVLVALITLNVISVVWMRMGTGVTRGMLQAALMLDVLALTGQLYLSGGMANPFTGLYLLQITLGALLLNVRLTWSIVSLVAACLLLLTQSYQPLALSGDTVRDWPMLQTTGLLVCYGLDAALLVVFITRISRNLRERDEHLAELKQRAAEEDHIVRMGLLASGAAHELGTPLASVAVILGDWRRMPTVADQPELLADIDDMQAAVQRCKAIVTGILLSTGEARGEDPTATTVNAFLEETLREWRAGRPAARLSLRNEFGADVRIVSDSAIKQVLANILDNAYEASPNWLELVVRHDGDDLLLEVMDAGPGFARQMLAEIGKPYRSTKGRLGGGLGLFLVVNVVRKLGGSVSAHNHGPTDAPSGACVIVRLPLSVLCMGVTADE
jgi:two-component system, sensor histidine kinase RegB